MKHALRSVTLACTLAVLGCVSALRTELSSAEIAEVLQIHAWHIPQPATGTEWSLEVVTQKPANSGRALERGTALISLRPTSKDEYEFVLKQLGAQASGTMTLCREPEGSPSICESYSLEFKTAPQCLDSCSRAVLAHLTPTFDTGNQRWLMLVATPKITIRPDERTKVVPIP